MLLLIISEAVVETMIETDGGDPSKVDMVDVGWDLMPAIATDNVDALTSAYINHEFVLLSKEGHEMEMIQPSAYGVPEHYELIIVTGEKTLKEKKPLFEKFWRALAKGQEAVTENPEAGLQVLLNQENDSFPLDEEIEAQSLEILLPLMNTENVPFGYQEEESWKAVIDWLVEQEIIKEKYDANEVFENIMSDKQVMDKTRKLTLTSIIVALTTLSSHLIYIPIGFTKIFPIQHFSNLLLAVLLGPWYAVAGAFVVSTLRNMLGTGSIFAYPGSMIGAFLAGYLFMKTRKVGYAFIGEIIGTGLLGAMATYPIGVLLFGRELTLFGFIPAFMMSSFVGAVIALLLLKTLLKNKVIGGLSYENSTYNRRV